MFNRHLVYLIVDIFISHKLWLQRYLVLVKGTSNLPNDLLASI